jgi:hypothetical protein
MRLFGCIQISLIPPQDGFLGEISRINGNLENWARTKKDQAKRKTVQEASWWKLFVWDISPQAAHSLGINLTAFGALQAAAAISEWHLKQPFIGRGHTFKFQSSKQEHQVGFSVTKWELFDFSLIMILPCLYRWPFIFSKVVCQGRGREKWMGQIG